MWPIARLSSGKTCRTYLERQKLKKKCALGHWNVIHCSTLLVTGVSWDITLARLKLVTSMLQEKCFSCPLEKLARQEEECMWEREHLKPSAQIAFCTSRVYEWSLAIFSGRSTITWPQSIECMSVTGLLVSFIFYPSRWILACSDFLHTQRLQ